MEQLQQLPTVGPKTASRLAFYLLSASKERVANLATAMMEVKERLRACTRCGNIAEDDLCEICRDRRRDENTICVVANTRDLMAMENSGELPTLISPCPASTFVIYESWRSEMLRSLASSILSVDA